MDATTNMKNVAMMTFYGFSDENFENSISGAEYVVMVNPTDFKRTFSVRKKEGANPVGSSGNEGKECGVNSEKYTFTLIIDGTGIIRKADVKQELETFLKTVYRQSEKNTSLPFVKILYCGESLHCKLDSLVVDYQLLKKNGEPLRVKLTCSFSSIEKMEKTEQIPPKTTPNNVPSPKKSKSKPIPPTKPTKECICVCKSFPETQLTAQSVQAESLFTSASPAYTSVDLNYTPIEMNFTPAH